MANRRTYTDDQLRAAVRVAFCWADVMGALGKSRSATTTDVRRTASRLGLDTSHFGYARSGTPVEAQATPFSRPSQPGGASGLSIAARWFLDRGYNVSIPMEPAPYDLVAESDEGLKRVQVKTTAKLAHGAHRVALRRSVYDAQASPNAAGKYRQCRYVAGEVDLFFIVTAGGTSYLIPFEATGGQIYLNLDRKYCAYAL